MRKNYRDNVEFILVEPSQPGNIGSSARAMNNMGFYNLGLVKPVDFKVSEAYRMAWSSHDIIDNAKVYESVPHAIKDKTFIVAMSTRKGKDRGHIEILNNYVSKIHAKAKKGKIAILFGCESYGLTNEDLVYANVIVRIHTASRFSSLNLAQAVLVTCYELFASEPVKDDPKTIPAVSSELEMMYEHVEKVLTSIGYGLKGERLQPKNMIKYLRKVVGRCELNGREVQMIRGICSQVDKTLNGYKLRK